MNWRHLVPLGISLIFSVVLVSADFFLAQVQRHLTFVAGWILVAGLSFLLMMLRHNNREVVVSNLVAPQRRLALTAGALLFLVANQCVYFGYEFPNGIFGRFLLVLFAVTITTGLLLLRAEYRLFQAVREWAQDAKVVRAETKDQYGLARAWYFGFLLAIIPVAVLNGILIHAHGALSNFVDKGVS